MRTVLALVFASAAFGSTAFVSTASAYDAPVAQAEPPKPPVKRHHVVKRPDPENATMPEKQDWISQTLGNVLDGIDDLGKPLRDPPR